ncbi:MAG: hypothetical protein V1875_06915 [Candidatus Altiarchaeota archaeon]
MVTMADKSEPTRKTEMEEIKFALEKSEKNAKWFDEHYPELQKKYKCGLLGIRDQKVVAAEDRLDDLLQTLQRKREDIAQVYITAIPCENIAYIL